MIGAFDAQELFWEIPKASRSQNAPREKCSLNVLSSPVVFWLASITMEATFFLRATTVKSSPSVSVRSPMPLAITTRALCASIGPVTFVVVASELLSSSELSSSIAEMDFLYNGGNEDLKERISALCIPFTLQEDIIASIKPIKSEIFNWLFDHKGIFPKKQEESLKFCFNADGELDRVKTANLLIHLEVLDVQARFVLACQYWSSWDILAFLKNLQDFEREQILHKYSTANENLNLCEKNAVQWVQDYKEGIIIESKRWCYQYYNWNYVSLQSHLLDDLTKEERYIVLDNIMEKSSILRINYFCLSRMNANHREDVLKRYPLTVVSFYLDVRKQRIFMDAVNKVKPDTFTDMKSSNQVSLIAKFYLASRTSDTGALLSPVEARSENQTLAFASAYCVSMK
ncbi:hypothetical protein TNCV_4120471 [Trichonephila clavipes]|nr:hypothetical protein TNCV_4120471 [Trichonephila clavipes]